MAEKMKPDKLMLDVRQADAAGLSYGRWRFEETERIRKGKEIIRRQCEERRRRRDEALSGKGSGASVEFKGNGLDLLDLTIQIVGSVVAEVPEPLRPYVIKKIQDKIPDAVQNDLEAQGKAAPAEKKEKPPVGETVGFRMARQFAETEPGFKDFIMALADKLSNG